MIALVAAISAVAVVDAVRGDRDAAPTDRARPDLPDRAEHARRLIAAGLTGRLVYADRACRLAALTLPRLRQAASPAGPPAACAFSLSPDGRRVAPGGAVWADARLYARCRGAVTEVRGPPSRRAHRTVRGCVPAWRPGAPPALTVADAGAVLDVPPGCAARACRAIAIGRDAFFAAAIRHPLIAPDARNLGGVDVVDVRWLGDRVAAAILRVYVTGTGPVGLVALVEDGELRVAWPSFDDRLVRLEPSPTGRYAVAEPEFAVGADGRRISIPPSFLPVDAAAWSPDEEWLALATRGRVAFVRARDLVDFSAGGTRLETVWIPLAARDLAWR